MEINIENYIKKFKVFEEQTLFPPNFDALKENRCPLCNCQLKFPYTKAIAYCNSKKHIKRFVITLKVFNEIKK